MAGFKLLLCLSTSFTVYLAIDALSGEGIITSREASQRQFPYLAIIMGQPIDGTDDPDLQGSAGIISSKHLLGAAQVFIDKDGNQKKLIFSAVFDEINAKKDKLTLIKLVRIFLPQRGSFLANDLSVSELPEELDLQNNPSLKKLHLPKRHPDVGAPNAIVAGYGYNWIELEELPESLDYTIKKGTTDGKLRYEEVRITAHRLCARVMARDGTKHFCGEMSKPEWTDKDQRKRGLCVYDFGSPLVISEKDKDIVVGVASTNQIDCNDEVVGGLYTNVEKNSGFIKGVINNEIGTLPDIVILINQPDTMDYPENSTSSKLEKLRIF